MKRRRAAPQQPPQVPPAGATTRTLPDGRRMVRAANAPAQLREVTGHGAIVLREITWYAEDGRSWSGWQWDMSLLRPPPGAVRADPHLQTFCCSGPKLWYQDIERVCVQCKQPFVFTAREQKFWYETLSFHEASTAIRCRACRKRKRTRDALGVQIGLALRAVEAAPRDADRWLELARVSGELRLRYGQGDINRGIGAARKAWRLSGERLPEALYWESALQRCAGREAKANELEDAFLAAAGPDRRLKELVREVTRRRERPAPA